MCVAQRKWHQPAKRSRQIQSRVDKRIAAEQSRFVQCNHVGADCHDCGQHRRFYNLVTHEARPRSSRGIDLPHGRLDRGPERNEQNRRPIYPSFLTKVSLWPEALVGGHSPGASGVGVTLDTPAAGAHLITGANLLVPARAKWLPASTRSWHGAVFWPLHPPHSAVICAALMIGHHFSISLF
jgi:hypothetical protein